MENNIEGYDTECDDCGWIGHEIDLVWNTHFPYDVRVCPECHSEEIVDFDGGG